MTPQKFPKNTFESGELGYIKDIARDLYKNQNTIFSIAECIDFIRNALVNILSETGKTSLEESDILSVQKHITGLIDLQEYIYEEFGKMLPITVIDGLRFGKSCEAFKSHIGENTHGGLRTIIERTPIQTLKNALIIAKNEEELKKLLFEIGIPSLLERVQKKFFEIFYIKNTEHFLNFFENALIRNFLKNIDEVTLTRLGDLGIQEIHLNEILDDSDFENFFLSSHLENARNYLLGLCSSMEDVLELGKLSCRRDIGILMEQKLFDEIVEILEVKDIADIVLLDEQEDIFRKISEVPHRQIHWFFKVFQPQKREELCTYFEDGRIHHFLELDIEMLQFLYELYGEGLKEKIPYFGSTEKKYFFKDIQASFLNDILETFDIKNTSGLENILEHEEICDFLRCTPGGLFQKIIHIFGIKNLEDLKQIFATYQKVGTFVNSGRDGLKNLNFLLEKFHIKTPKEVISVCNSEKSCRLLQLLPEKFQYILSTYPFTNLETFIAFAESLKKLSPFVNMRFEFFKEMIDTYPKEILGKLSESRYLQSETTEIQRPSSRILFKCFDAEIQGEDALSLMEKKAKKVLRKETKAPIFKRFTWKKETIHPSEMLDLSIYVRIGGRVDYPEIADALIIFAQHYIAGGYSRVFKNIRIIPRHLQERRKPSKELFESREGFPQTNYYTVAGEKFQEALHEGSLAVFLSHSSHSLGSQEYPNLISQGMEVIPGRTDISSEIELEAKYTQSAFTKTADFEELFEEFFGNLRELEKAYIAHQRKESSE